MITCIIIDDEPTAIESLQWELGNFKNDITVLETFTNVDEAISFLEDNMVEAVFLDVEMPKMNGFEFLERYSDRKFAVIITTAYDEYALPALKKQCLDFLSKPTDKESVADCISKLKTFVKENQIKDYFEEILIKKASKENVKKITLNCDGKLMFLVPEEIIYCESDGNYSTIFMENKKKILVTMKLKQLEEKLNDDFFRIHNSYIINLNKVQEYLKNDGYVILTDQSKIPVSRQKKMLFLGRF